MARRHRKVSKLNILITLFAVILALVMLLPIVWSFFCSIQSETKQFAVIWDWFKPPYTLENYPQILAKTNVFTWLSNSLVVAVATTVLAVLTSTLAAYAIAKIPFRASGAVFAYFMIGMLVPGEATIIPMFILCTDLGLIDSYAGLILPMVAGSMTLIICVSFFRGIPTSLMEAVRIDGGSEFTIYTKIALPLSKPILSTVSLMSFLGSWNNYLWPLLCEYSESKFTLPVGIPTLLSIERPNYVIPMTANMVASIPAIILYLLFEKQIVQGVSMDGIKG